MRRQPARLITAYRDQRDRLLAACVLGPGFHSDGATLLEEAAYYLQHSHPQLADELKRKAAMERAAIAAAEGEGEA